MTVVKGINLDLLISFALALSPPLFAEETEESNEKNAASEEKSGDKKEEYPTKSLYFQYNTNFAHRNHGLEKTPGTPTPTATTQSENLMYLGFNGMLDQKTQFAAYISLIADNFNDAVEVANATYTYSDRLSFSVGKNYLIQGGFDNQNWVFETIALSPYTENFMPLPTSGITMEAKGNHPLFGTLTLQLTDDVQETKDQSGICTANCNYYNKKQKQPLLLTQWYGTYGLVMPMVQFVPYDGMNHSRELVFSLGIMLDPATVTIDQVVDTRKEFINGKDNTDTYKSTALDVTVNAGTFRPFLKYTLFDKQQGDQDHRGNLTADTLDDNGAVSLVGCRYTGFGEGLKPFVGLRATGAKILDDQNDVAGKSRSTQSLDILFGASGTI